MSSRRHPSVDSNKYSRLDTFSEASTSESSSSGTYEDKSQETSEAIGKGKAQIAAMRSKKPLPKFNRGVPITEIFLKTGPPKRARVSVDPLEFVPHVPPPEMVVPIQIVYESDKGSSSSSIKVEEHIQPPYAYQSHIFRDQSEVLKTYAFNALRPATGGSSSYVAFSLEDSVEFMCTNAKNFVRSSKEEAQGRCQPTIGLDKAPFTGSRFVSPKSIFIF
ncbi:hypothetical protein ACOSQ2_026939 [Xanthoceras sorbifolium]